MKKVLFALLFILSLVGILILAVNSNTPKDEITLQDIANLASQNDYHKINLDTVVVASDITGNMPENIIGSKDAPVKIYEYADYQCSSCASFTPMMEKMVKEYNGKVAIVFRAFILSKFQNSLPAALAANAAARQGYWQSFSKLLFEHQSSWYKASPTKRQALFENYLRQASDSKANILKFREDMHSEAVKKKTAFDFGAGQHLNLPGTPAFYLNREKIIIQPGVTYGDFFKSLKAKIDPLLSAQKN